MKNKIHYLIFGILLIITLVACELFTSGYGNKVDLSEPEMAINSSLSGSYVAGTFTIDGTASDDTSIKLVEVQYYNYSTENTETLEANIDGETWSLDIDTTSEHFIDGETEFTVTSTDSADKTISKKTLVYIDNSDPTVLVTSPDSDDIDIVNGTLVIKGEVDDQKLDRVEVYIVSSTDDSVKYGGVADGTSSWKYEIDTLDLGLGVDAEESFYLDVIAYDEAGNSSDYFYFNDADLQDISDVLGVTTVTLEDLSSEDNRTILTSITNISDLQKGKDEQVELTVLQEKDTPIIELGYGWDDTTVDSPKIQSNAIFSFNISDDDGLDTVVITVYDTYGNKVREGTAEVSGSRYYDPQIDMEEVLWSGFTMDLTVGSDTLAEGKYYLTLVAEDVEVLEDDEDPSGRAELENPAYFIYDSSDPELTIVTPVEDDVYNDNFEITGTVYDEAGISSFNLFIDDTEVSLLDYVADDNTWTYEVDVTTLSGVTTLETIVTDISGKEVESEVEVFVDSEAPVITYITPDESKSSNSYSGNITLWVELSDDYAVDSENIDFTLYDIENSVEVAVNEDDIVLEGNNPITFKYPLTGIGDGNYRVSMSITDSNGFDTTSDEIYFTADSTGPELTVDSSFDDLLYYNESFTITGTIEDVIDDLYNSSLAEGEEVRTLPLEIRADFTNADDISHDIDAPTNGSWEYEIDLSGVLDGEEDSLTLYISAYDNSGNTSGTITKNFIIDKNDPEEKPLTSISTDLNGVVLLTGEVSDNNLESVQVKLDIDENSDWEDVTAGLYLWKYKLDTNGLDGDYDFHIKGIDKAGNEEATTYTISVDQDSDIPEFSFDNTVDPTMTEAPEDISVSSNRVVQDSFITGYVSDDDGIDPDSIVATFYSGDTLVKTISATTYGTGTRVDWEIDLTDETDGNAQLSQGIYSFNITVSDDLDAKTYPSEDEVSTNSIEGIYLAIDNGRPELTESSIGTSALEITNGDLYLEGTASDGFELSSLTIEINSDDPIEIKDNIDLDGADDVLGTDDDNSWIYTDSLADGNYVITLTATDGSGYTTTVERNVLIDKTVPTVDIFSIYPLVDTNRANGTITVSTSATDVNGLEDVKYWILLSTEETPTWDTDGGESLGDAPYSISLDTTDTGIFTSGDAEYNLYVIARDKAGNDTIDSETIEVDQDSDIPTVDFSNITKVESAINIDDADANSTDNLFTSTVKLLGTLSDDDSVDSSSIEISLNSDAAYSEVDTKGTSGSIVTFSHTFTDGLTDGDNYFYIKATDENGVTLTEGPLHIFVDSSNPELTITNNQPTEGSNVKSTITLEGTVVDTHLDSVEVFLDDDYSTFATVTDETWSLTTDASNFSDEGSKTITVNATDKFGKSASKDISVVYDKTAPTLSPAAISSEVDGAVVGSEIISGDYTFTGTSSDVNSNVSLVQYSLNGGVYADVTGTNSWNITVDTTLLSEGSNSISFTATDSADNTTTAETLTFIVDQSAPELDESTIGSTNIKYTNDTVTFSGTSSDTYGDVTLEVFEDSISKGSITIEADNSWTYTSSDTLSGSVEIEFVATDIAGRTTTVVRNISIDTDKPSTTVDEVTGYVSGNISISGNATDTGSGISLVEYQLDGTAEGSWTEASGSDPWLGSLDLSSVDEGERTLYVRVKDYAGNYSESNNPTSIYVDKANPVTTITSDKDSANTDIEFSGTSSDSNELSSTTLYWSLNGGSETEVTPTTGIGTWSWTLLDGWSDGNYTVRVESIDVANKSTSASKTVKLDNTAPEIEVTAPLDGGSTDQSNFTISGTTTDLGVGFDGDFDFEYKVGTGSWTEITLTGTSWSEEITLGATEGSQTIEFRSTDALGNVNTLAARTIYKDDSAPKLTETAIGIVDTQYTTDTITFSGVASDTNELTSLEVKVGSGSYVDITDDIDLDGTDDIADNDDDNSWSYISDDTLTDGTYNIQFRATDVANKTTEITRNFVIDSTEPTLTITELTDDYAYGLTNISGTIYDAIGVDYVEYQLQDNTWEKASLTSNGLNTYDWKGSIELLTEGSFDLHVRAYDKAGNSISDTELLVADDTLDFNILVDELAPVLSETTIGDENTEYGVDTVTIGGTVEETHFNKLEIYLDAGLVETITTLTGADSDTWTYTTANDLTDGNYVLTVIVTDNANRTDELVRNITIDSVGPDVAVNSISGDSVYGLVNVSGTIEDDNVDYVTYELDSDGEAVATLTDNGDGTYSWSGTVNTVTEGSSVISVVGYDKAGHSSIETSNTFEVDESVPTLTESVVGSTIQKALNTDITINGTAEDTYGLDRVEIYVNSVLEDTITTFTGVDSNEWSYTHDTENGTAGALDGSYQFRVVAFDNVNKETELYRNYLVDTVGPVIVSSIVDGDSTSSSTPTISGTISDYSAGLDTDREITVDYTITDNLGAETSDSLVISTTTSNWGDLLDFGANEGQAEITLTAEDILGNSTTTDAFTLYYDASAPTLDETTVATTDTKYTNINYNYSGVASDTNELVSVTAYINDIKEEVLTVAGDGSWSFLFDADRDSSTVIDSDDEGTYTIIFRAEDIAGKTTDVTRTLVIDTTSPSASIAALPSYANGSINISGTASDTKSGVEYVEYQLNGTDEGSWSNATGTTNWLGSLDLSSGDVSEGLTTLYVRSKDYAGNVSDPESRTFNVDKNDPEVTITADVVESNSDITFSGTSLDSNSLYSTTLYWSVDGGDETEVTITPSSDNWSWLLDTDLFADGTYNVRVVAEDDAGNTDEDSIEVILDTTAPVLSVDANPSSYFEDTLTISGGATDNISGVDYIEYSYNDIDWSTGLSGSSIWFGSIDIDTVGLGTNTIYLRSRDKYGNISGSTSHEYVIDRDNPVSNVTGSWGTNEFKTGNFTISGEATDNTSSISSVTVSGDGLSSDYISNSSTWSTEVVPTVDGENSLTITTIDSVGRQSIESVTYFYDNTSPEISTDDLNISEDDLVGNTSYTVVGLASDTDGSGIAKVEYRHSEDNGTTWLQDWTEVTGTETWSVQLTGLNDSQTHYIEFRATDNANLISSTTSVGFTVDTNVPVIGDIIADRLTPFDFEETDSNTTIITTNQAYGGSSSEFALKLQALDSIGIAAVSVNIDGVDYDFTDSGSEEAGYEIWTTGTLDVGSATGISDGTTEWVFTVTDSSGLETTATKTVLIDNTAPEITHTYPGHLSDIVNGEVEVKGLGEDDGSGLSSVEYQVGYTIDSSNWSSVDGTTFSWEVPFTDDGIGKIDNYVGQEITSVTDGLITLSSHGFTDGTPVWIGVDSSDNMPAELSSTTTYYVEFETDNSFYLSTTEALTDNISFNLADGAVFRVSKYAKDSDSDAIWELPVVVRATDSAGNTSAISTSSYVIKADPSGDKPNLSIVYPDPDNTNRTMGGIIRIFGTATDDDGVGEVYVQVDVDGDGDFDSDDIATDSATTNWYQNSDDGELGQLAEGTASWNISINTEGEFNPVVDSETNTINFRVRVRDITGVYGPWSDTQEIIVDNDVPKIGSSVATTLVDDPDLDVTEQVTQTYVADMWIKDVWTLVGSIEDESDISRIIVESDQITELNMDLEYSEIASSDYFTVYTNADDNTYGYEMSLPVDTTVLTGTSLSITITAYDDKESNKSSNSTTFNINFDNTAPTLDTYEISDGIEQSNNTFELASSLTEDGSGLERVAFYFLRQGSDDTLDRVYNPLYEKDDLLGDSSDINRLTYSSGLDMTGDLPRLNITDVERADDLYSLTHSSIEDNYNVRVGGLIKIGGIDRVITDVDYSLGTVTWDEAVGTGITSASIAYAFVVDNFTIETPNWDDSDLTSITNDDGDFMVEAIERSGGLYDWSASINSKFIPDGPIELHWVAYDMSGNSSTGSLTTSVLNNRPKLAKVTLGTDLDGDGTVIGAENYAGSSTDYETVDAYSLTVDGENQAVATAGSSAFIAKGLTTVDIEVVGGNGELQYEIYDTDTYTTDTYARNWIGVDSGTSGYISPILRDDDTAAIQTIEFETTDLNSAGTDANDGNKEYTIKIWDSTEETTIGSSSQWATLTIPMIVDVVDGIAPSAAITPFFWNSDTDNSLMDNSSDNGHIDLESDLPTDLFIDATGLYDTDPKVSGKISVRGTATDGQRVDELYINIDNMEITGIDGSDEDSDVDTVTLDSDSYQLVAYLDSGSWVTADKWSSEGWTFSITDSTIDQSGHTVNWQLDWDTSYLAEYDDVNEIYNQIFTGTDNIVKVVAVDKGGNDVYDGGDGSIPSYSVDVVPFITDIARFNDFTTHRTKSGAYPLLRGEANNTISGFNFTTGQTLSIVDSSGNTTSTITITYDETDEVYYFTMPTDAESGWLNLSINGVATLNNSNSNSKEYNSESVENVDETDYWYDDRYVRVFESDENGLFDQSEIPVFPAMSMDDDGVLYSSFSNYSTGSVYYSTLSDSSRQQIFYTYDPSEETDIIATGSGEVNVLFNANYHGGADSHFVAHSRQAGGLYLYDDDAEAAYYGKDPNANIHRMELFYHNKMLQQWKNIRVARGSNSIVHSSYYDRITGSIHYSNVDEFNTFTVARISGYDDATEHENPWVNIDGGWDDDDFTGTWVDTDGASLDGANVSSEGTSIVLGRTDADLYEGDLVRTTATDEYSAIAIDNQNFPVIVYLDAADGELRLARANSTDPHTEANWKVQTILSSSDENETNYGKATDYFSAQFDTDGKLHIIFRNSKSELCYIVSTNNPEDGAAYTFGTSEVIDEFGLWADLTIKGTTPYISYMSKVNAYDGIKIAFIDSDLDLDGDGTTESGWETMTAAMNYKSSSVRTSIETHPTGTGWTAAVGFTPGDYYRVVYYIDE